MKGNGVCYMIFRRKVYNRLLEWKAQSKGSSAVLVEGARRIGKSTLVKEFAQNEYDDFIILDFAKENEDVKRNFDNIGDMDTFFRNLFLLKGKRLPQRKAVIIFDEVQLFPIARQAVKYLVEDGRYDYIETGSLISIKKNVQNILIPSEEEKIKMYPMDFEEFLWASGDMVTADEIRTNFAARRQFSDDIHRSIMQKFRTYMAVGGMPQAVLAYVEGKDYRAIDYQKRRILTLYEDDLKKYDVDNGEKASVIFKTIPEQLQNHNSHFKFSKIDKNARYKNYVDAVSFVGESMIGNECIGVTKPEVSLESYADRSNFKLYMGDTGLLVSQYLKNSEETENDIYKALIFDHLGIDQGMILENMVAQMLRVAGHDLYFHEFMFHAPDCVNEKKYEIDFLLVRKKKVCILEVKSSNYSRHKSFDYFLQKYKIKSEERYIICTKNYKCENNFIMLPAYMTFCL